MMKVFVIALALALPSFEARFLEQGRSHQLEKPKEAKKDEAKKEEGKKEEPKKEEGPCAEAKALKKEIAEMKPTDKGFMKKIKTYRDAVTLCRDNKGQKAQDKADAKVKKEWTKGDIQQKGFALEKSTVIAKPDEKKKAAKKEEPKKKDDGLGKFAACRSRDELKEEVDKMDIGNEKEQEEMIKKLLKLVEMDKECRELQAQPKRKEAKAETKKEWEKADMTPSSALSLSNVFQNETMHLRAQQSMEVDLGPFASAEDACNYCFGSFTKEGDKPAGPVAPFCVCMAYPEAGKYNMFCATPPSAAEYIQKKNGCRCKAKDMEAMGKTTCKPI
jgi:chemotaxis protein histidine kinase CheA